MTTPPNMDASLREEVFVSTIGHAPPRAAAELESFFLEVHRCCVRWLAAHGEKPAGASAFVLSERLDLDPVYEKHAAEFSAADRLDREAPSTIPGPILLTSRNLRVAFARRCKDPRVSGIVKELRALGLEDRPTAFFLPAERTLTFYACGVDAKPTFHADAGALSKLDPTDVAGIVAYFHENWTRFPDGLGACWDNAGQRVIERNAERNIRNSMFVFLSMVVYGTDYIAREYQLPNGRVDIFIYGVVFADPASHCVLELKVLRSRSSGWKPNSGKTRSYSEASNKRYVEKGLRQASRYKVSTGAARAFLCCFDARLENVEINVHASAGTLGVEYRRFFMESSVKEL